MELLVAIIFFALPASITPGPNNIMLMSSGVNHGIQKSLPHLFGVCIGFPVMLLMIGFGLGVVFKQFPIIHEIIRIVGLFYLLYLAYLIARTTPTSLKGEKSVPFSFLQSILFQWINPKSWIVGTGALSTYTTSDGFYWQVISIVVVFLFVTCLTAGTWLFFGSRLRIVLKNTSYQRIFNIMMASLLLLSVTPLISEYALLIFNLIR